MKQMLASDFPYTRHRSEIWRSFQVISGHVAARLAWQFRDGGDIPITYINIIGLPIGVTPSRLLIHCLAHRGINFISQTIRQWSFDSPEFKSAQQIGLPEYVSAEWEWIKDAFRAAGFRWANGGDLIVWAGNTKDGAPVVKETYNDLNLATYRDQLSESFFIYWKRRIPTKIVLFGWLVWQGRILTGDNLCKRGFMGPFRCNICCQDLESVEHLFFNCPIIMQLWRLFSIHIMGPLWAPSDFMNAAKDWDDLKGKFKSLPFFFIWEVWRGRNRLIFDDTPFRIHQVYSFILGWLVDRHSQEIL